MIMRPGQRLLMPVNPGFVWLTLVLALLAHMLFSMLMWGRAAWAPDLLSIVLVFFPLAWLLRNTGFYRWVVVTGGSVTIAVLGIVWTLERTGLFTF